MAARVHFTVDDVEEMIPALERIFAQVLQLRAGLHALSQKLDRAGLSPSRVDGAHDDASPPAVRQARAVCQGLDEARNDEIERVRSLGGQRKDTERGLADFP